MLWLHSLLHYSYQLLTYLRQVDLFAQLCAEGFQGMRCVVPATIETPINRVLNTIAQWLKEGSNGECRTNYRQIRLGGLPGHITQKYLQAEDTSKIDNSKYTCQCDI